MTTAPTNYDYTLENAAKRCSDLTAEEFATLELTTEFQTAMDLPDDVEFARGETTEGEKVTVYRKAI